MRLIDNSDRQWMMKFENKLLLELYAAYLEARRGGKRGTFDEHKFEANEFENLIDLRDTLLDKTYRPSRGTAHIIHNPVMREIFAASFRDRVVHHWMYDIVYDWWDRHFIEDSYSCREGKGTGYGIERISHHLRSAVDEYGIDDTWIIKMDIQSYFMSLPRKQLYERAIWGLDQQFKGNHNKKYELMKFCWEQTIMDDPCRGVKKKNWPKAWENLPKNKSLFNQPAGRGIVIGNLTSQLSSNIYLDQLDRYVKFDLGYDRYGRYVDDFIIITSSAQMEQAMRDIEAIRAYLKRLGLTLHPNKLYIQKAEKGVDFLGARIYPGEIYPGERIIKNASTAFYEVSRGTRDIESVVSYLGHMKHMSSSKLLKELFDKYGWDFSF